jgi:hypothetical protein
MASEYINTGTCSECYQYITDACPDTELELPTGLSDGTEITWEIEDKFGAKWRGTGTVDVDGNISIPVSGFPEGMFNPHAGIFILRVLGVEGDDDTLCEGIDLTICDQDFSCIAFSFTEITQVEGGEFPHGGYGYTETE